MADVPQHVREEELGVGHTFEALSQYEGLDEEVFETGELLQLVEVSLGLTDLAEAGPHHEQSLVEVEEEEDYFRDRLGRVERHKLEVAGFEELQLVRD